MPWPTIISLFYPSGPSAIRWLVVAVIVLAIQCPPLRSRPHVGQKVLKLGPPLAHRNPSTAVQVEPVVFRVVASGAHLEPRGIFSGATVPMDKMGWIFTTQAPAASSVAGHETATQDYKHNTALTLTFPESMAATIFPRWRNYGQSDKAFSGEIARRSHDEHVYIEMFFGVKA